MLDNKEYTSQYLLISFTSALVVLIIITTFISYTAEIGREARINMLKMSQLQIQSANRMLFSRATILNLQMANRLDASLLNETHQGGVLTYGEMLATKDNIRIFISLDKLFLNEELSMGKLTLYPEGLRGKNCYLAYYQPYISYNQQGEIERQSARYIMNITQC